MESANVRYRAASGAAAAFYVYSAVDAFFFHSTEKTRAAEKPPGPAGAAWRSALVPGWGQFAQDKYLKGSIFFGGTALAAGAMLSARESYRKASIAYDTINAQSLLIASSRNFLLISLLNQSKAEEAHKRMVRASMAYKSASAALAGIYLFNIFDAFFFHSYPDASGDDAKGAAQGDLRFFVSVLPMPAGASASDCRTENVLVAGFGLNF